MREKRFEHLNYQFTHGVYITSKPAREYFIFKNVLAIVGAILLTLLTGGTASKLIATAITSMLSSLASVLKFEANIKQYTEQAKKLIYKGFYGKGLELLDEVVYNGKRYRLDLGKIKLYADNDKFHEHCCETGPFGACKEYYKFVPLTIKLNINPLFLLYLLFIVKSDSQYSHLIDDETLTRLIVLLSLIAKYHHPDSNCPRVEYKYVIKKDTYWEYSLEYMHSSFMPHVIHDFKLIHPNEYPGYASTNKDFLLPIVKNSPYFKPDYFHYPRYDFIISNKPDKRMYSIMNESKKLIIDLIENSSELAVKSTTNKLFMRGKLNKNYDIGINLYTLTPNIAEYTIISSMPQLILTVLNAVDKMPCSAKKKHNVWYAYVNDYFNLSRILEILKPEYLALDSAYPTYIDFYDKDLYQQIIEENKPNDKPNNKPNDKPKQNENKKQEDKKENKKQDLKILIIFMVLAVLWTLAKE